jgi:hypothetical protein
VAPYEKFTIFYEGIMAKDERAKICNEYNFFLNKDFISDMLDVDPLAI